MYNNKLLIFNLLFLSSALSAMSPKSDRASVLSQKSRSSISSNLLSRRRSSQTQGVIESAAIGAYVQQQQKLEAQRLVLELNKRKSEGVSDQMRAFGIGFLAGATVIGGIWALKQNPEGAASLRNMLMFKKG